MRLTLPDPLRRRQFNSRALAWLGFAWGSWGSTSALAKSTADLMLATPAPRNLNPADYLVSEKLDGVRAIWDGSEMRFRSGRAVAAPDWFLALLPKMPLDGELWMGRGLFDKVSGAVRKTRPVDDEWRQIKYMVFDLPGAPGSFSDRVNRMALVFWGNKLGQVQPVEQFKVASAQLLQERLKSVAAGGGEGLMLHLASATYAPGRSAALLKLKPVQDAEAVVVGHTPGKGKYEGQLGALEVRAENGLVFKLGTGFSDDLRKTPPPIGSTVTYTYRDITPKGIPRFASFLRVFEEL